MTPISRSDDSDAADSSAAAPAASSSGRPAAASPALALAGLLGGDGFFARRPPRPTARRRSPTRWRPKPPHFAGQGQERHLPVHVRRAEPGRHVRLQAEALRARRQDDPGQDVRPRRARRTRAASSGRSGSSSSTASAASGSATCSRNLGDVRRRHRVPPLDDADSPIHGSAMLQMNTGKILSRQPVPRLVGQLRPGQREREPARLRRHARPDRRADQRRQELVERLHAGRLPGRRSSARPATPILDLQPPDGHDRGRRSGGCSTRCSEYNAEHLRRARRQHRSWPPGSPATSWPTRCSSTPPRRSTSRRRPTETHDAVRHRRAADRRLRPQAACWPAGWSSAACGSSSSTPAATTTTTTGTPTATS